MISRDDLPETPDWQPDWLSRMNYGTCPRCHEYRFIGHGPLCGPCYVGHDDHIVRGDN